MPSSPSPKAISLLLPGSRAGAEGGGRTHTFGISHPATKLKGKAVYARSDVRVSGGKAIPRNGV